MAQKKMLYKAGKLDFPTRPLTLNGPYWDETSSDGRTIEEYVIPENEKEKIFRGLWPSSRMPKMDEMVTDIHSDQRFKFSDCKIIYEDGINLLVTPLYGSHGGTAIDIFQDKHMS